MRFLASLALGHNRKLLYTRRYIFHVHNHGYGIGMNRHRKRGLACIIDMRDEYIIRVVQCRGICVPDLSSFDMHTFLWAHKQRRTVHNVMAGKPSVRSTTTRSNATMGHETHNRVYPCHSVTTLQRCEKTSWCEHIHAALFVFSSSKNETVLEQKCLFG